MLKILFTTDYSSTADNAFRYALNMCENYKGELYVLHTYSPNVNTTKDTDFDSKILSAFDLFQEHVQKMRLLMEDENLANVNVKFILEEGELVQTIQELIEKENFHLLIMGTNGKSGFENKILGSKTMAVIKNAYIPVISVPHLSKFEGIDSVGFTTIYDEIDFKVLELMLPYTKDNNSEIFCLHVNKLEEKTDADVVKIWKEHFKKDPIVFVEREGNDVVKTAFDFMEQQSLDLISCVTRNKSFIEELFTSSVAKNLAYHKRIPLLTYNENFVRNL